MICKFNSGRGDRERLLAYADVDERERQAVEEATARRAAENAAEVEDDNLVTVTEGDLEALVDEGSVVVFTGTDAQDRLVTFAVDHRPARGVVEAVREQGSLVCYVEDWQILRRTAPVVA